jgi:hypothetical protein
MHDVDHIDVLYLRRELLLGTIIWSTRIFLVIAADAFGLLFGQSPTRLLDYPTIAVGMSCRFVWIAMDLARPVQDFF